MRFAYLLLFLSLTAFIANAETVPASISGMARVIDGDTISIRQTRIRIAAIDACEIDQMGERDGREWSSCF